MSESRDLKVNNILRLYPHIWKTESALLSYLRGGIRRGLWEKNPVKLEFIKNNRKMILNTNPRGNRPMVWGGECNLCNKDFIQKELVVDHLSGNNSLRSINELETFIENIVLVTSHQLQLVCKPCHDIKSYSDKHQVSFKRAARIKEIIKICAENKDKEELIKMGVSEIPTTKIKRRQLLEKLIDD